LWPAALRLRQDQLPKPFEDGTFVIRSEYSTTYMFETLPYAMEYDGSELVLVEAYTLMQEIDYEYGGVFCFVADVSKLTDRQLHWLLEEDVESRAYIDGGKNEFDFTGLRSLGKVYDDRYLYFCFMADSVNRNPIDGSEVSLSSTLNNALNSEPAELVYTYSYTISEANYVTDEQALPDSVKRATLQAINMATERYVDMLK
jgi:hypothetical protein